MQSTWRRWRTWMVAVPPGPRSALDAIAWWERRRLGYNVWLIAVGAVSLALHVAAARLETGAWPSRGAVFGTAAIAVLILNGLYTFGWVLETHPKGGTPEDRVALGAFLEMWCWAVAIALIGTALMEFMPALGAWLHRR